MIGTALWGPRTAHPQTSLICGGRVIVPELETAFFWWQRMRGLLGRASLAPGRGLYLAPAPLIHTCFMRFTLDLIFLSRELRVVRVVRGVRPFRFAAGGAGAWGVVEVAAGWLPADEPRVGDLTVIGRRGAPHDGHHGPPRTGFDGPAPRHDNPAR